MTAERETTSIPAAIGRRSGARRRVIPPHLEKVFVANALVVSIAWYLTCTVAWPMLDDQRKGDDRSIWSREWFIIVVVSGLVGFALSRAYWWLVFAFAPRITYAGLLIAGAIPAVLAIAMPPHAVWINALSIVGLSGPLIAAYVMWRGK